jgi:hypothetical protein
VQPAVRAAPVAARAVPPPPVQWRNPPSPPPGRPILQPKPAVATPFRTPAPPRFPAVIQPMIRYCEKLGCNRQARPDSEYCAHHFSATFSNMQHLGDNNSRKNANVKSRMALSDMTFFSEVGATTTAPTGLMVMNSQGHVHPSGSLNYMAPFGSTIVKPTISDDDLDTIKDWTGSKATTYEGLWDRKKHPRFPVDMGLDNTGTRIYGYHAKSSPNDKQRGATAVAILFIHDQHPTTCYAIGGDINMSPDQLALELNAIRPNIVGTEIFIRDNGSTHRRGGSLDYVVTNVDPSATFKIGHSNMRGGPDHTGTGFKY